MFAPVQAAFEDVSPDGVTRDDRDELADFPDVLLQCGRAHVDSLDG